jgi:kynurenine formamidase
MGTHIDAPAHFGRGGLTLDQLPTSAFLGDGVVLGVRKQAGEPIAAEDLAYALGTRPLARGDLLLLSTGWAAKYGSAAYDDHPHLTLDAAQWIATRGVKLLGIDFLTPDRAIPRRGPNFEHEVHRHLLPRGILIVENLASLERFEGRRVQAVMLPLHIRGADGAPVCALVAMLPETDPPE